MNRELQHPHRTAPLDALIVPTARPVQWLHAVMELASNLDCIVVALCSRQISADEARQLGGMHRVTTVAIDVTSGRGVMPIFGTSTSLDGTPFERTSDVSWKRNLVLLLARTAGWQRILFLDDDIRSVDPSHARAAATLLEHYPAVGLENVGFPDNSVVCHAFRHVGGRQAQFVGAGALAVAPQRTQSFFPHIYNDDWFFLIGDAAPPRVAVTGRVSQLAFDPFDHPGRARRQELGDCLAEGVFWLLDNRRPLERADRTYWRHFLARRRRFISWLLGRVRRTIDDHGMRTRVLASLQTAHETCLLITPDLCAEFMAQWRSDLITWRRQLDKLPTDVGLTRALHEMDLRP